MLSIYIDFSKIEFDIENLSNAILRGEYDLVELGVDFSCINTHTSHNTDINKKINLLLSQNVDVTKLLISFCEQYQE